MAKNKMNDLTKAKLTYSGELIIIAIAFMVIGILQILKVILIKDWHHVAFNWITLFGGIWLVIDFIWVLVSKKRRAKNSLLDKSLHLPVGIYLITFDLLCFCAKEQIGSFYNLGISILLLMVAPIYIFEGVYHWYKPLPAILTAVEEVEKERAEEELKKQENESNQ